MSPEEFDTARVLGGGWVTLPSGTNHYFDAPANQNYDIVAFAYRHGSTSAYVTSSSGQVNAKAQIWRHIPAPTNLVVTVLDGRHVRVTWVNHVLDAHVDSTEVWRSSSLWQRAAGVSPDSQGYTDSVPAAGVYHYSVRHVGNFVLYSDDDVGGMSRPNSPAPADTTVTLGAAAPTNLSCAGTLIPTIPCTWTNTVPGDSVVVYRGGQVLTRLGAGVTSWTDGTVTLNQTYVYQVAHIDAGYTGLLTNPDTVVATASAPLQLGCSGLKDQAKVFCSWYNTESADTLQLQRSTTSAFNHNVVAYRLLPATGAFNDTTGLTIGTTYYYRIQYVRGMRASAWGNTDTAVPGTPDPILPPP